jgi:hypothetical protein
MPTATANVTGAVSVGRSPEQSEAVVVVEPQTEADDGKLAQLKETIKEKKRKAAVFKEEAAIAAHSSLHDPFSTAWHVEEAVERSPVGVSLAANLAAGAVMLLITLMIVLLSALVGGKFAAAVPSDSVFSDAINTTTDNAGTAFVIFGVSLLAIPTVSVLAYVVTKLGPFIGFGNLGGGGGGMMRRR